MKNQKTKFNKSKLAARVMLVILLITSAVGLFGCYFGATIVYNWEVNMHDEFVAEIEKYNSVNDGFINTFISFDLDKNEDVSKRIYQFYTITNNGGVNKFGLCDKICSFWNIGLMFYLKSNIENSDHNEHAYKIICSYDNVEYTFSEYDKIEIKQNNTDKCGCKRELDMYYHEHLGYSSFEIEDKIYTNAYYFEMLVNDVKFACIHISSIEEASEEKLNEIIQMLLDNMVIINTEE